jgi:hypothetical protein
MKPAARLARLSALLLALAACQPAPATAGAETAAAALPPAPATASPAAPSPSPAATPPAPIPSISQPAPAAGAATPDPNLGVGAIVFQDALDGSSGFDWSQQSEAAMFTVLGGQLNAVMQKGNLGFRLRGGPRLTLGDQQARVTVRVNLCYERDEYGLLFRAQEQGDGTFSGYLLKLNCAGQARVEQVRGTATTTLVDWSASPAIVPGAPAENTLLVWAAGPLFRFFVNDRYLFEAHDGSFTAGTFAVYLRDRTNGGESVSFANLVARAVSAP